MVVAAPGSRGDLRVNRRARPPMPDPWPSESGNEPGAITLQRAASPPRSALPEAETERGCSSRAIGPGPSRTVAATCATAGVRPPPIVLAVLIWPIPEADAASGPNDQ